MEKMLVVHARLTHQLCKIYFMDTDNMFCLKKRGEKKDLYVGGYNCLFVCCFNKGKICPF